MDAAEFFGELFADKGDEQFVQVSDLSAGSVASWWRDAGAAAAACDGKPQRYFCVSVCDQEYGPARRVTAETSAGVGCLWMDVDVQSEGAHKQSALPATKGEARQWLQEDVAIAPSIIVDSGHGLQAFWLLQEMLTDRTAAARLIVGWQAYLISRAAGRGWRLDKTSDLARLMRVPGSVNSKTNDHRLVFVLEHNGRRYIPSDFEPFLLDEAAPTGQANGARWKAATQGSEAGSRNVDLMSFLGKLSREIADLDGESGRSVVIECGRMAGRLAEPPLEDKEILRTAVSAISKECGRRAKEDAEQRVVEALATEGPGAVEMDEGMRILRERLGGIPILKVEKIGQIDSAYWFHLEEDVSFEVLDITNQRAVRRKVLDATKGKACWSNKKDAEWVHICKLAAIVSAETPFPDAGMREEARVWVEKYLGAGRESYEKADKKASVVACKPFCEDGLAYISVFNLCDKLKHSCHGLNHVTARKWLKSLGFTHCKVSVRIDQDDGSPAQVITKHYWRGSL